MQNHVYPYLDTIEGDCSINNRIFIGKNIPEKRIQRRDLILNENHVELIGSVAKNVVTGAWQL